MTQVIFYATHCCLSVGTLKYQNWAHFTSNFIAKLMPVGLILASTPEKFWLQILSGGYLLGSDKVSSFFLTLSMAGGGVIFKRRFQIFLALLNEYTYSFETFTKYQKQKI